MSSIPKRRHPDCKNDDCKVCLEDHRALELYFLSQLWRGPDWLGEYRTWLDKHKIPAEANGWGSREAFDPTNINAFVAERTAE